MKTISRCPWVTKDPLYISYHDKEWGRPIHDDKKLFEAMLLDTFQAGLSWFTILKKRENFRKAFRDFDPVKISKFNEKDVERLMNDEGIIRNRLKVLAAISNAKAFLATQKEFGSFDHYIWQFTGFKTIYNYPSTIKDYRSSSPESDAMSRDLKARGFKFVGTTICYAFMQAVGMVNDHSKDCFFKKS